MTLTKNMAAIILAKTEVCNNALFPSSNPGPDALFVFMATTSKVLSYGCTTTPGSSVICELHISNLPSITRFGSFKTPYLRKKCTRMAPVVAAAATDNATATAENTASTSSPTEFIGLHHVGFLCENLEKSLEFYCGVLGLKLNPDRPENKLPYRGSWLWVGSGMIHLMELPNPDPTTGRPEHGGRDRHACITVKDVNSLKAALDAAGIPCTASKSGRPALFTRDPDGNALEFAEPV